MDAACRLKQCEGSGLRMAGDAFPLSNLLFGYMLRPMPLYKYHFAKENPDLFQKCVFPASEIAVWFEQQQCGFAQFTGDEDIELVLPQAAIDHIEDGTGTIIPLTSHMRLEDVGPDLRIDQLSAIGVMTHDR